MYRHYRLLNIVIGFNWPLYASFMIFDSPATAKIWIEVFNERLGQ